MGLIIALTAAACASGGDHPEPAAGSATGPATAAPTAAAPTGTAPSSAAPTPTASPSAGHPPSGVTSCAQVHLHISGPRLRGDTMPGPVAIIVFRNTAKTACSLKGWPKVALLGPRPGVVPVRDMTATGAWAMGVTRVVLRPGGSATSSMLIATPASVGECGMPGWALTPPGGPRPVHVRQQAGDPQICAGETLAVSPVYPGQVLRVTFGPSPGHSPM
ncbi:MAG: DUF4232 domain-containing protein [Streptosporangiaceae bacterium]|jgi:hypothetical protein